MMMQMLAEGGMAVLTDGLRAPDEDNPRGYFEFDPVKRAGQDVSWVTLAEDKAVKVVHVLLRCLPPGHQYRVVFMRRAMAEVLASQAAMLTRSSRAGAGLPAQQLGAIFESQVTAALTWLAAQPNFSVLAIDHAQCLSHPASTAAKVNAFLGGGLDETAMAAAVDPALHRQKAQ